MSWPGRCVTLSAGLDVDRAGEPWPLDPCRDWAASPCSCSRSRHGLARAAGGAAIAPGVVKVDMNRKTVQHQEGGIVGEILVRDGTRVKAGPDAHRAEGRPRRRRQRARPDAARRRARQGRPPRRRAGLGDEGRVPAGARGASGRRARGRGAEARNLALPRSPRGVQQPGRADPPSDQGDRGRDPRAEGTARGRRHGDRPPARGADVEPKPCSHRATCQRRACSACKRSVAELESRRGENESELARARQKVADLELRAETLRSTFMQEAATEFRQTTAQIFDLRERLRPAQDAEQRQRITAPIDGEVVDLRFTSVGAVIGPRDADPRHRAGQRRPASSRGTCGPRTSTYVRTGRGGRRAAHRVPPAHHADGGRDASSTSRPTGSSTRRPTPRTTPLHIRVAPEALREGGRSTAPGRHAGGGLHPDRVAERARVPARPDHRFPAALDARALTRYASGDRAR